MLDELNKENLRPLFNDLENTLNTLQDKVTPILNNDDNLSNRYFELLKLKSKLQVDNIELDGILCSELQKELTKDMELNTKNTKENELDQFFHRNKQAVEANSFNEIPREYQNKKLIIKPNSSISYITTREKDNYVVEKVFGPNNLDMIMEKNCDMKMFGENLNIGYMVNN
jgi:hypothetical protein